MPATPDILDRRLTRKEVAFVLGICRQEVWKMQRRGLVFIRGEIRLSALADFLVGEEMRKRAKN